MKCMLSKKEPFASERGGTERTEPKVVERLTTLGRPIGQDVNMEGEKNVKTSLLIKRLKPYLPVCHVMDEMKIEMLL